jgi:hypothetical protein
MLVKLYAIEIINSNGEFTIDNVPAKLKQGVIDYLSKLGYEELDKS